jgi:hypothetical protein
VSDAAPDSVAVAHVCYSWPEAEVVACSLNAAGIPAIVADRNTVGNLWYEAVAIGGFRVLVPRSALRDAAEIVEPFKTVEKTDPLPQSNAFWQNPTRNAFFLLISFIGFWCPIWLRRKKG